MELFLDELEKPAEAYRGTHTSFARVQFNHIFQVNLQDIRKGLVDLRDGLKRIRQELGEHFADDLDDQDIYCKQMWSFSSKANEQVEDLVHDVNNAESTFIDVISYYGEDEKKMTSSEFYGIFKTFVTSYKVRSLSSTKAS